MAEFLPTRTHTGVVWCVCSVRGLGRHRGHLRNCLQVLQFLLFSSCNGSRADELGSGEHLQPCKPAPAGLEMLGEEDGALRHGTGSAHPCRRMGLVAATPVCTALWFVGRVGGLNPVRAVGRRFLGSLELFFPPVLKRVEEPSAAMPREPTGKRALGLSVVLGASAQEGQVPGVSWRAGTGRVLMSPAPVSKPMVTRAGSWVACGCLVLCSRCSLNTISSRELEGWKILLCRWVDGAQPGVFMLCPL